MGRSGEEESLFENRRRKKVCEMRVGTFGSVDVEVGDVGSKGTCARRRVEVGRKGRGRQERAGAVKQVRGGGDRVVGVVEWKGRCEDTGRERQVRLGRSIGVVVKDGYTGGDACAGEADCACRNAGRSTSGHAPTGG